MTLTWSRTPADAWSAVVKNRADNIEKDTVIMVDRWTSTATAWMKENARWTDRSEDARNNLYSDVLHVARQTVSLLLSHGPTITYAQYLEANPRFAILGDAVDQFAPLLFRGLQEIAAKHGRG